jgi:ABC-2 type transport system ATP-binding protein
LQLLTIIPASQYFIMTDTIEVRALQKSYGKIKALDGLDLNVKDGTVHALLGPNGAGKTTAVRILATLLRPDGGQARIFGTDVVNNPRQVRAWISLTGQHIATDSHLTGRENLELIARLRRLPAQAARSRTAELLHTFELTDAADRQVRTYSGGMQRRLDLAMSLTTIPRVLFLDEPTINLDPHSRRIIWGFIEQFVRDHGVTVVLTTQYLEEADRLAHHVSIIDKGKTIAVGTPEELKMRASGDRVELTLERASDLQRAEELLRQRSNGQCTVDQDTFRVTAPVTDRVGVLPLLVRDFDQANIRLTDLVVRRPTLDDAFLAFTGHSAADQRSKPARRGAPRS